MLEIRRACKCGCDGIYFNIILRVYVQTMYNPQLGAVRQFCVVTMSYKGRVCWLRSHLSPHTPLSRLFCLSFAASFSKKMSSVKWNSAPPSVYLPTTILISREETPTRILTEISSPLKVFNSGP